MKLYIGKRDEVRVTLNDYYLNDDILNVLYKSFLKLLKERRVQELGLSIRAENTCLRNRLLKVGDLLDIKDAMKLSWCGLAVMKEVYENLNKLGFQVEAWNPKNYYKFYNERGRKTKVTT